MTDAEMLSISQHLQHQLFVKNCKMAKRIQDLQDLLRRYRDDHDASWIEGAAPDANYLGKECKCILCFDAEKAINE